MHSRIDCRQLIDSADDAIVIVDDEGQIVDANPKAVTEFGYAPEEFRGRLLTEFHHPDHREMVAFFHRRLMDEASPLRITAPVIKRDGSVGLYDIVLSACHDDHGKRLGLAVCRDVTAGKAREESLNDSNRHLSEMAEAMTGAVHIVGPDLKVLHCSQGIRNLTGGKLGADDLVGRCLTEVFPFLKEKGVVEEYRRVFETGERVSTTETNWWEGKRVTTRTDKVPVTDSSGRVVRVVTTIDDVSREQAAGEELALKNAELEALNKELNSFISMTSHELRSPLTNIEGFARLLEERLDKLPMSEIREFVGRIISNSARLHALIDDLLTFARERKRAVENVEVDLNSLLDEVLGNIGRLVEQSGAKVDRRLGVRRVVTDRQKLSQVLKNLLENAVTYRREGVVPEVSVETVEDGLRGTLFRVADNGEGIPATEREVVFEIFKRGSGTRGRPGTGVGLALVRENVTRLGGAVALDSVPGSGSVFSFTLPAPPPEAA